MNMKAQAVCAGAGLHRPVGATVKLRNCVSWLLKSTNIKN